MDNQTSTPSTNTTTPLAQNDTDMNSSHQADASSMIGSQPLAQSMAGSSTYTPPVSNPMPQSPMAQPQVPPMQTPPLSQPNPVSPIAFPQQPTAATQPIQPLPMNNEPTGVPPQTPPVTSVSPETAHKAASGKMVFMLVIILVLIAAIGGYLLFSMYQKSQNAANPVIVPSPIPTQPVASPTASMEEDPDVNELNSVSPSDEVDALENDVEGSDFSTVDAEVPTLEEEL